MAETIGPMTELDAVNEMLISSGQSVVASLSGTLLPDANTAMVVLRAASRDLQEQGWHFNTDYEVELTPDVSTSKIAIPTDALRIDGEESINVAWRNGFLYDLDDNTFEFDEPMDCTIVRHFAFAELPQVVRRYVTALGMEKFHAIYPPLPEYVRTAQLNLVDARAAFLEAEVDNGDYNVLSGSLHVSKILRRGL